MLALRRVTWDGVYHVVDHVVARRCEARCASWHRAVGLVSFLASPTMATPATWLRDWQSRHHPPAYRPGRVVSSGPPTAIPLVIFQTTANRSRALNDYGKWMRTWWRFNPQHAYHLFVDEDASDFVMRFCSESERAAYRRSLVGAQRADLFRIYFLREVCS